MTDRQEQIQWLEEIAGDLTSCNWVGTPRELVAFWEEDGNEQSALPEWYDEHDRQLLVRTLGGYMAQDVITQLEDELYGEGTGYHTFVTIEKGGKTPRGLDYNPREIKVVVLNADGVVIAYRYVDDAESGTWLIGTPEDVGKCWLVYVDVDDED